MVQSLLNDVADLPLGLGDGHRKWNRVGLLPGGFGPDEDVSYLGAITMADDQPPTHMQQG